MKKPKRLTAARMASYAVLDAMEDLFAPLTPKERIDAMEHLVADLTDKIDAEESNP